MVKRKKPGCGDSYAYLGPNARKGGTAVPAPCTRLGFKSCGCAYIIRALGAGGVERKFFAGPSVRGSLSLVASTAIAQPPWTMAEAVKVAARQLPAFRLGQKQVFM